MIVWVAGYPRSGNTFFRILMKHLYGLPTYTGFMGHDDLQEDVGRGDLTGHRRLPEQLREARRAGPEKFRAVLDELDREDTLYVFKTHELSMPLIDHGHRAVLLVRDARDALCSHIWYHADFSFRWSTLARRHARPLTWAGVLAILSKCWIASGIRALRLLRARRLLFSVLLGRTLNRGPGQGTGPRRWVEVNRSWVSRPSGATAVLRFEDLIADPVARTRSVLENLGILLRPISERFPTFAELKEVHGAFFRSGMIGGWREDLSEQQEARIWAICGDEMAARGYSRS